MNAHNKHIHNIAVTRIPESSLREERFKYWLIVSEISVHSPWFHWFWACDKNVENLGSRNRLQRLLISWQTRSGESNGEGDIAPEPPKLVSPGWGTDTFYITVSLSALCLYWIYFVSTVFKNNETLLQTKMQNVKEILYFPVKDAFYFTV
jgi:hypothetical protein